MNIVNNTKFNFLEITQFIHLISGFLKNEWMESKFETISYDDPNCHIAKSVEVKSIRQAVAAFRPQEMMHLKPQVIKFEKSLIILR